MTYNLDWDKLKEDCCPSCGWVLSETSKGMECNRHKQPFFIPLEKYRKIKNDLEEQDYYAFKQPDL
jgi:hypothetical protein